MIQISLTQALALYSFLLGLLALGIWIYTELTVWRRHKTLGKQFLWHCIFCGYTYLDESAERISKCPRCASFNSIEDANTHMVSLGNTVEEPAVNADELIDARRNPSRRKHPHQRRRGPRKHHR